MLHNGNFGKIFSKTICLKNFARYVALNLKVGYNLVSSSI